MPELPEVETLRRGLERETRGWRIAQVEIANRKVLKGQAEAEFQARTLGTIIEKVDRRGKYLLLTLGATPHDTDTFAKSTRQSAETLPSILLCIHLKMRGQILLESASTAPGPYHCISLILEEGSRNAEGMENATYARDRRALRFYDMWTWGEMRALTTAEVGQIDGLARMGAEPLDGIWDGAALRKKLTNRHGAVKTALLDQKVVAGVGNIYADESLFRSRIHPERPASSLDAEETDRLAQTIRQVLTEAVAGGGTMSEEYVDLAGRAGRFTPRVYDRGGAPCVTCGTTLAKIRLGGRGTVFCPSCQN